MTESKRRLNATSKLSSTVIAMLGWYEEHWHNDRDRKLSVKIKHSMPCWQNTKKYIQLVIDVAILWIQFLLWQIERDTDDLTLSCESLWSSHCDSTRYHLVFPPPGATPGGRMTSEVSADDCAVPADPWRCTRLEEPRWGGAKDSFPGCASVLGWGAWLMVSSYLIQRRRRKCTVISLISSVSSLCLKASKQSGWMKVDWRCDWCTQLGPKIVNISKLVSNHINAFQGSIEFIHIDIKPSDWLLKKI